MRTSRFQIFFLTLLGAVLFFSNIGGYDLWPADEPRFGEVAREMLDSHDYLVPRVNGEPYREKPPLLFWAVAAASKPFGDVTAASARVPSGIAALATVLITYLLAARLYDARTAFWAALILMTGTRFWWQARTVQTDMLLTACLTAALLAFWLWHETHRRMWLCLFYLATIAAVYTKGPPGIVFPLLLVFTFYWRQKDERRRTHWVLGTAAVAAAIALWLIPARMAASAGAPQSVEGAIAGNLFRQIIGRFFLGVSKAHGPWYYFETLPVDWLPWTLFLPWTLPWVWKRRREGPQMRLLLSWTVPAFVFFSICIGKRAIYLLPLFPAIAILIARSALDLAEGDHSLWWKRTALVWGVILLLVGVAPFFVLTTEYRESWNTGLLFFSTFSLGLAAHTIHRSWKTDMRALNVAMAGHFAGLAFLCGLFVLPAINHYKSARPFCEPLRRLVETGQDFRLYSVGFSREEYIFYAKKFHQPALMDIPLPEAPAKQYKRLRRTIQKASNEVHIDSFAAVTQGELDALAKALQKALTTAELEADLANAYESALIASIRRFAANFERPIPAFLFVQERDWRWLLPLNPAMAQYPLIKKSAVGSREVLLIANLAGGELAPRCSRCLSVQRARLIYENQ